ncbi:putative leucine rich repeat domain protein [Botrytis cinerea BcDW1]|uniref:Putative leucine rich repeat domain protein n=1 Tax=Botryotinia fuckeliana (strain BcDW1) TaxID=1290391 RepID=M7TPW1_BOTF1|nr:putative leucine rich repeat domain protein [Botrytis cinerea BcDW1]
MEDPLPAYHEINKDVATLIAPYLNTSDLYFGSLVNSHFNEKLGNYLWANPFRDLAQRKQPCEVVTRFFLASPKRDLRTRKRVRILDLRALHEIRRDRAQTKDCVIFGPHLKPEWFFKFFTHFPNLNCILLAPTCSEDYDLGAGAGLPDNHNGMPQPEFLSAAGCNTFNLSLILNHNITQNLIYLDASETARSTNWKTIFTVQTLPKLRILKLRGLRLTDTMLPPIVTHSRGQIWSLDLRDNLLTDNVIYSLIRGCFLKRLPNRKHGPLRTTDDELFEDPPIYRETNESNDPHPTATTTLRPDSTQEVESFRHGINILERRNNAEDNLLLVTGLTHLYISNNKFTALAPKLLLASTNLTHQERTIHSIQNPPPNRRAPPLYPGLRELILEFLPLKHTPHSPDRARSGSGVSGVSSSITDDQDADTYYRELASDFSFLTHQEEETQENSRVGTSRGNEKAGIRNQAVRDLDLDLDIDIDIVEELKEWRNTQVLRWGGKLSIKLF